MINLLKIAQSHFSIEKEWINEKKLLQLLDTDLKITPEELAVHIYFVQQEIIELFGETEASKILLLLSYIQRMYTQIEIYYSAQIGKNFRIIHGLGTVIGARTVIGDNVTIYQNVTLGDKGDGTRQRPTIGNGVTIYAGSKVLGGITIGDHSVVGANSVVLDSFPERSTIIGAPARQVRERLE